MIRHERKEDAVSPVIGVMLILVVTIIIAAVITGFATDLSKDTEKTPTALFEAQYEDGKFTLKHKGGDPILLKNIQLVLEQSGGSNTNQIIYTLSGAIYVDNSGDEVIDLTVRGQEPKNDVIVSTSDVIQVNNFPIPKGSTATWTLNYVPTNGLIASGETPII